MNIILKGFDDSMGKILTESMTKGIPLETCISIGDVPEQLPDLPDSVEHIVLSAEQQRMGEYPDTDWNAITPLDEEIIASMRHCEAVFLKMVGRYAIYEDIPYDERKRQYLRHLRYWSHTLRAKKIDLFLMRGAPHQCYDLVIWDLCKLMGIRVLTMSVFFSVDAFSVETEWEDAGASISKHMEILLREYADIKKEVTLSPEFEEYYEIHANERRTPWFANNVHVHLHHRSFTGKWLKPAIRILVQRPLYLLKSVISVNFWQRKLQHHKTRAYYDRVAKEPDITVPFIYFPLQQQPEATTCPMAGAYVDQELMVQMLAACAPKGVRIYVKEHPNQGELWRDIDFYKTLHAIPSVTIVPRNFNTFDLSENAVTTASATGTACFEGLFKGRPAIMFGHKFFQYAPGVYRVRTTEDCRHAMECIFEKKVRPTLRELRIFLKAIEDCAGLAYARTSSVRKDESREERARKMGAYVRERIVAKH